MSNGLVINFLLVINALGKICLEYCPFEFTNFAIYKAFLVGYPR